MSRYTAARLSGLLTPGGDRDERDWRERALCRALPDAVIDEVLYPFKDDHPAALKRASDWCEPCPVASECLAWAMRARPTIEHGIFAGTGPARRQAIIAAARRTGRPVEQIIALVTEQQVAS